MSDDLWKIPITVNPNLKEGEVLFSKDGKWFDAAIMLKNAREKNEKLREQLDTSIEYLKEKSETITSQGRSLDICARNYNKILAQLEIAKEALTEIRDSLIHSKIMIDVSTVALEKMEKVGL